MYFLAKNQIIELMHLLLLKYKPPIAASSSTAGTSVPSASTISDIYLSNIPTVNRLEVYHYFGFTSKPSS